MELFGRRLKYEDEIIYLRKNHNGKETKKEIWVAISFRPVKGYLSGVIKITGRRHYILKHRLIYKFHHPDWDIEDSSTNNSIDHINGNPLDNRIENLRLVTHQHNQWNHTRAKGYYKKPNGSYVAQIKVNMKHISLGTYKTEEEARDAYLKAKKTHHVIQSR